MTNQIPQLVSDSHCTKSFKLQSLTKKWEKTESEMQKQKSLIYRENALKFKEFHNFK